MHRRLFWAVGIASSLFIALLAPSAARAQEAGKPVCADCHEEAVNSIALTKHGAKLDNTDALCRSCHGDVAAHLEDPTNKPSHVFSGKGMLASEKSSVCLSCHDGSRQLAFWDAGKHKKNDVACSDCHTIHAKRGDPSTATYVTTQRKLQYETCITCHKTIRSQLNKTSHHPIFEGKVACSDCHNPHGAVSHAMVKNESVNQLCVGCHADKRGPFVWAHMPVEENCLSCHNSHGSNVPKLLNVKVPQLCQDCHGSAHGQIAYGSSFGIGGANQDRATRFDARACVNCHQMIHGSNAPASRGQFLLR
jgi:DmsE family decaheme c-type cytochrome